MATAAQHKSTAETLVELAVSDSGTVKELYPTANALLAAAQIHATLATVPD